jgi:hypothetical protein
MRFFKRARNARERVEDLKARVESLRKHDDGDLTLEDFLGGDDAVSARGEVRPREQQAEPPQLDHDVLKAELERYISRIPPELASEVVEVSLDPAAKTRKPSPPPAPAPRSVPAEPKNDDPFQPKNDPFEGADPPRLSADDEAALIAELQRYVQRNADAPEAPAPASETPPAVTSPEAALVSESQAAAAPEAPTASETLPVSVSDAEPVAETPVVQEWSFETPEPAPESAGQAAETPPAPSEAFKAEMERFARDLEDPRPGKPAGKATDGWQPL